MGPQHLSNNAWNQGSVDGEKEKNKNWITIVTYHMVGMFVGLDPQKTKQIKKCKGRRA